MRQFGTQSGTRWAGGWYPVALVAALAFHRRHTQKLTSFHYLPVLGWQLFEIFDHFAKHLADGRQHIAFVGDSLLVEFFAKTLLVHRYTPVIALALLLLLLVLQFPQRRRDPFLAAPQGAGHGPVGHRRGAGRVVHLDLPRGRDPALLGGEPHPALAFLVGQHPRQPRPLFAVHVQQPHSARLVRRVVIDAQ